MNFSVAIKSAFGGVQRVLRASLGLRDVQQWFSNLARLQDKEVTRPMAQSTTVYRCVRTLAETISGLRLIVHTGNIDKPLTSGPAFDLLNRPSPDMSLQMFIEQLAGHYVESGEVHVFDPDKSNITPRQLIVVGRRQMTPHCVNGELLWWWYQPIGGAKRFAIETEYDSTMRMFNPYDPHRGLGPIEAAMLDIKQSYSGLLFNTSALQNGGAPGGMFTLAPGTTLSPDQKKEVESAIKARFEGPTNANRPFFAGGGMDYKSIAFSNTDLELAATRKLSREEICSAFGVPPVLAGIFESAHYDVADQSIQIFLLHIIGPLCRALEALLNLKLLPRLQPGATVTFDTSDHPAMLALLTKKIEALKKALDNGTPYNEAAPLVGLKVKPQPWGDRSLMPGGMTPIEDVLAGGTGLPPGETESPNENDDSKTEGEEKNDGPEARNHRLLAGATLETAAAVATERREEERLIRAHVPRFRNAMRAHFARQLRQITERLRRAMKDAGGEERPRLPWELGADEHERIAARVLLSITDEAARLKLLVRNTFPAATEAALREKLQALGWEKEAIDKAVKRLLEGKGFKALLRIKEGKIAGIERVTHTRVKKQIIEGLAKGETVTQISDRVRIALGGTDAARALTIARTEVGQAVSTGRHLAMKTAGVTGKSWIKGRNPRPSHELAQLEYGPATPIAIDKLFHVGESYLMHPRDPRGAAGEIINCNCVQVPRRLKPAASVR